MRSKSSSDTQPENTINNNHDVSSSQIPWVRKDLLRIKPKRKDYYYDTNDLVMIALFSALGGVFSTFIGYLGNLINHIIGVPWGGGQIVAGLHVFWIVFVYLLSERKVGVALLVGILKGFIEFFSGSAHGILVVVLSGSQGLIIEIIVIIFLSTNRQSILSIAAGLASLSNVIVQQILFFNSQIPLEFITFVGMISFISGLTFGGILPSYVFKLYSVSPILTWRVLDKTRTNSKHIRVVRGAIILAIVVFDLGILLYLTSQNKYSAQVLGDVNNPYTFFPKDFISQQVTVEAELIGDVTYIPPKNYTGIPLKLIIERSMPKSENYHARIEASDGYFVEFSSNDISSDLTIILSVTDIGLQIVAGNFHGSFWVRKVTRIVIIIN